jgi:Diadenosine tetraphosphate (Ap4A) hydrolase and other HIT family hydrolases
MSDCVFCLISQKRIPSEIVYEDEYVIAFKDLNPEAPVHILIIPKKHIPSLMEAGDDDLSLITKIYSAAKKIAAQFGISENGFRIVTNCGRDGGQTVNHLHFHLLGGRSMQWPPG